MVKVSDLEAAMDLGGHMQITYNLFSGQCRCCWNSCLDLVL